jgi:hypothetical protein
MHTRHCMDSHFQLIGPMGSYLGLMDLYKKSNIRFFYLALFRVV